MEDNDKKEIEKFLPKWYLDIIDSLKTEKTK